MFIKVLAAYGILIFTTYFYLDSFNNRTRYDKCTNILDKYLDEIMSTDDDDLDELFEYLASLKFFKDKTGYLFLIDKNLNIIFDGNKSSTGNLKNFKFGDSKPFHEIIENITTLNQTSGFLTYESIKPNTGHKTYKVTQFRTDPNTPFILCMGYYVL